MSSGRPQPRTRYARSGDVHIAYQVVGEGPLDLVFVPGFVSHLELAWEEPSMRRFLDGLVSFARLILFDKRGTGMSDRVTDLPTLEQRMDDVRAVMDAAGSERAVLMGVSEGGPMSILFSATYPERVTSLILYGSMSRFTLAPDYEIGFSPEVLAGFLQNIQKHWGEGAIFDMVVPSMAGDPAARDWFARWERQSASPGAAMDLIRMDEDIDVRAILPTVHVPTLVVHARGDRMVPVAAGRYMAERIPGAVWVELDSVDHLPWSQPEEALAHIQEFLTGQRPDLEIDRVLATVLFTDIVGSTERAAELGDRRWRDLLERHHAVVRRELQHFRGVEVDTAGDGFLATFDGPARGIRCAKAVTDSVRDLGLEVRAGLHTGECERMGDRVGGIAVHIGSRVASSAKPGEVLVSSTVKDLVAGSGIRFEPRGSHVLKGVPGEWQLFRAHP
jgi:class 3 adenylate cyclase